MKEVYINYLATTLDDVEIGLLQADTTATSVYTGTGARTASVQNLLTASYINSPTIQIFLAGYYYHEATTNDINFNV